MSLFLCVDCGGSKTSAVICDASGKIVGRGLGGPSNYAFLSSADFLSSVTAAVGKALQTVSSPAHSEPAPFPPHGESPFAAVWFGISGVDSPAAIAKVTSDLSALLKIPIGSRLLVSNDIHLLASPLRVHTDVTHAVAVIAGTGSNAVSLRMNDGNIEELGRIGGWGWMLGDEGGGFHVGREAIRQMLSEHEIASVGGQPQPQSYLTSQVLNRFGITDIMDMLSIIHLPDPSLNSTLRPDSPAFLLMPREKRLSSLSPLVFDAAFKHEDPLALKVLHTCAAQLASSVSYLLTDGGRDSPKTVRASDSVICFGGSLTEIEAYSKLILDDLAEMGHVFRHTEYIPDPAALGAVGLLSVAR